MNHASLHLYQYDALSTEEYYHLFVFATSETERDTIFTALTLDRSVAQWFNPLIEWTAPLALGTAQDNEWMFSHATGPGYLSVDDYSISTDWAGNFTAFLFETPISEAEADRLLKEGISGRYPVRWDTLNNLGPKVHLPCNGPDYVQFHPGDYDVPELLEFYAVQSL